MKEYVKKNLARYKVPREVVFLEELPRNATGKVLKRELGTRPSFTEASLALEAGWLRRPMISTSPGCG